MKISSLKNIPSKVITWFAFVATLVAIVGGMFMLDERYARADDVQKTQEQLVKSIQLITINLEMLGLKDKRSELKSEKRQLILKVHEAPDDIYFKIALDEVDVDLTSICNRIDELEGKIIIE